MPVWFLVDADGSIVFTTGKDTVKGRALVRDGRASVCVDEEVPPYSYVRIDGRVELSEDMSELPDWATRIAARYMGPAQADAYGHRNAVPGELLVRLRPDRVVALADIAG